MEAPSYDILQSLKDHPVFWIAVSIAWVASCAFVWKLELMALERNTACQANDLLESGSKEFRNVDELKKLPWYTPEIGSKLNETMRVLLEEYAGVSRYHQEEHIYRVVSCPSAFGDASLTKTARCSL